MTTQYTIASGNTLGGIAQSNNTTIPNLMSANPNIKDPNKINAGSTLNIPGNASATNPALTSDAAKTFVNNQVNGNNPTTPTTPTTPVTPPVPTATDNFKAAYDKYINAQGDNTGVSTAKSAYNDYVANQAKGGIALEGRGLGVPLQLVRGEQAQLLKQSQPEATRLQNSVTIAQGDQTNKINAAKTSVDYNKVLMDNETAANKLATTPFDLSSGQDRFQYNPTTKTYDKIASGSPKVLTPSEKYGSGSIGEYNFAKDNGYKGTFSQYQNEDANRKAVANRTGTQADRTASAVSNFNSAFTQGAKMKDGTAVLDPQGHITPVAWKAAIKDAPSEGLTRAEFIKEFGNKLYLDNGKVNLQYGLTPTEMKLITG